MEGIIEAHQARLSRMAQTILKRFCEQYKVFEVEIEHLRSITKRGDRYVRKLMTVSTT